MGDFQRSRGEKLNLSDFSLFVENLCGAVESRAVGCVEYFAEITYNYKLNKLNVQWNAFLLNGVLKLY